MHLLGAFCAHCLERHCATGLSQMFLIISCTPRAVVNYEYAFYWSFYLDGSIGYEIKLTGELSTNLLSPGEESPGWGTYVADRVNSQHHQHMFCARLDFAVDDEEGGKGLKVSEVSRFII